MLQSVTYHICMLGGDNKQLVYLKIDGLFSLNRPSN